jgi:hypothetical protein
VFLGTVSVLLVPGAADARRPRQLWYKITIKHREHTVHTRVIPNVPNSPITGAGTSTRTWRTETKLSWELRGIEPTIVIHQGQGNLFVLGATQAIAQITDYSATIDEDAGWREPPCPYTWTVTLTSGGPLPGLIGWSRSTEEWGLDFFVGGSGSTLVNIPGRTCTVYGPYTEPFQIHTPGSVSAGTIAVTWQGIPHFAADNRFGARRMTSRRSLRTSSEIDPIFTGETNRTVTSSRTNFIFTRCSDQTRPDLC